MITATELRDVMAFVKDQPTICAEVAQQITTDALNGYTSCVLNVISMPLSVPLQHYLELHGYSVKMTDGDENYCVDLIVSWE